MKTGAWKCSSDRHYMVVWRSFLYTQAHVCETQFVRPTDYYYGDKIKRDETDRSCSTDEGYGMLLRASEGKRPRLRA